MELSGKLLALLSLTATPNNVLARAINVDSAQISRLRTGARKAPHNPILLRNIASHQAKKFENHYMISALFDLTGDSRLQGRLNEAVVSDVIFDWLTYTAKSDFDTTKGFLESFNAFADSKSVVEKSTEAPIKERHGAFRVYRGNDGKRRAVADFFKHVRRNKDADCVRLYSDTNDDAMYGDNYFELKVGHTIQNIADNKITIQRIITFKNDIGSIFTDMKRWLSIYVTGNVQLYSYPGMRDELHRMTILVLPEKMALYTIGLSDSTEAGITILTTHPVVVRGYNDYFLHILKRCRPIFKVYTKNRSNEFLSRIRDISMQMNSGIYKCGRLSAHTLPGSALSSMKKRASPFVEKVLICYELNEKFKYHVLQNHSITDIMSLPNLKDVMDGKEPIPCATAGKETLFYTPLEYRQHLEHILWYLNTFPSYHAVLLNRKEYENVVIYTKGNERVIMIKQIEPFSLFEITDQNFAAAIIAFLKNLAANRISPRNRQATISRLKKEIAAIDAMICPKGVSKA